MFGRKKDKDAESAIKNELMFTDRFLIRMLWPLFIEQFLIFAVGLVDSVMVASVGEAAVSAVSLVDSIMMLITTVMIALSTGGAVVVGQYLGQKKKEEACEAADQLMLFTLIIAIVIMALLYIFRKFILPLIFGKIEEDVMHYSNVYYLIVIASIPFQAVYNSGAALFRSVGNSQISMKISFLMNGINVVGNAVLIFGFDRGVEGVAIPTLVSRIVAAAIIFVLLRNSDSTVHISRHFVWKLQGGLIKKILRIGVPNCIENSMFQLGRLILTSFISTFGTVAIAANAVGNAVSLVGIIPGTAVGMAVVSIVSHCSGAGDDFQVRYYTKKLLKWSYASMFAMNAAIIAAMPLIIKIYALSVETGALAAKLILLHSIFSILIWPLSFTLPNALRAVSDVTYTMVIGVGSMWIFRICLAVLLGMYFDLGVLSVWIAMIVDWVVRSLCFVCRYRSGKWKR